MIYANDVRIHTVVCAFCKQDRYGHRRDNGECVTLERAEVKPYSTAQRPTAGAAGWRFQ